ncbi:NAD(P)H-dependent glycerol-3-phosphate dehydrogenase [Exilibacterium tricleocarpae]|uniref:Glycerol-3-phosphate dehydrogenase [NAD(P)+] n=1 Tax=Exilibacterium tricleocarpae TaxID=2591008 RepID=A0A545SRV3_9GAMM|nr:NAD(P)H-dependent glycerol-3-phosphate dehydrogenase [Exilibacterium tricleocarpae]TQV67675.1 NAD(P)H-dependent glycerol-3-phosphate dehydrogenase [Exilibacterium tricleocarpae]
MVSDLTIAVLGGGSFGTAIANIIATNGNRTFLWMRDEARAATCQRNRENPEYLPGYALHDNLQVTADLPAALQDSDLVFISVPSKSFRQVTRQAAPLLKANAMVVSTTKGIEPETFTLMSEILRQELGHRLTGVLSGPNFAKEIVQQQQTGTVVASSHAAVIERVQGVLSSSAFRVYSNHDSFGVELSGALKNIYAIVAGMAAALGSGHNTQAMLITRSLAEMGRFAARLGANPMTFLGLAGVGDLVLTCTSDLSRNYRVGFAIGKGKTLEQAVAEVGQVAEGVNTLRLVKQKADQLDVYMPLVDGLYKVLFEQRAISEVAHSLMVGEQNTDVEYISQ